ncbi:hypothetical protein Pelo_19857 [Pelomyxa schiedti]|nr:hypothetical protein Pelo_19857 [Pelomyxa schiedti]
MNAEKSQVMAIPSTLTSKDKKAPPAPHSELVQKVMNVLSDPASPADTAGNKATQGSDLESSDGESSSEESPRKRKPAHTAKSHHTPTSSAHAKRRRTATTANNNNTTNTTNNNYSDSDASLSEGEKKSMGLDKLETVQQVSCHRCKMKKPKCYTCPLNKSHR